MSHIGISAFFSDNSWHPLEQQFNLTPMLTGSFFATAGAILISIPVAIGIAIYMQFYAHKTTAIFIRRTVEMMTGIPSVVYGLWGMTIIVPAINRIHAPGASLLAGIIVLGIMILPLFVLVTDDTFSQIKNRYYKSAKALGISDSGFVWRLCFATGREQLISGYTLGVTRAVGETMAILMVCGNVVQHPQSLFDPIRTLTSNIALEMSYATDLHQSALFVGALILSSSVLLLILVTRNERSNRNNWIATP